MGSGRNGEGIWNMEQLILWNPPRNLIQRPPIILLIILHLTPLRRTGHHCLDHRRSLLSLIQLGHRTTKLPRGDSRCSAEVKHSVNTCANARTKKRKNKRSLKTKRKKEKSTHRPTTLNTTPSPNLTCMQDPIKYPHPLPLAPLRIQRRLILHHQFEQRRLDPPQLRSNAAPFHRSRKDSVQLLSLPSW